MGLLRRGQNDFECSVVIQTDRKGLVLELPVDDHQTRIIQSPFDLQSHLYTELQPSSRPPLHFEARNGDSAWIRDPETSKGGLSPFLSTCHWEHSFVVR